ncbi:hypothetical protein [Kineosporia sp. R_H_3]|uniref:hypothetical protein n=1 Tax=Kineosporia sp. R_H_3 TaxID=1961848 RepID=UPI000B4B4540|nr:hypothetical protein [Kineosporia sp. R_H_3]
MTGEEHYAQAEQLIEAVRAASDAAQGAILPHQNAQQFQSVLAAQINLAHAHATLALADVRRQAGHSVWPAAAPAAVAWAVLDANDRVRLVTLLRDEALRTAGEAARDGYSVRPLVFADLDDVAPEDPR